MRTFFFPASLRSLPPPTPPREAGVFIFHHLMLHPSGFVCIMLKYNFVNIVSESYLTAVCTSPGVGQSLCMEKGNESCIE